MVTTNLKPAMAISTYLSIITLNVNGLNAPMWSIRTKEKLKKQNSSRTTEPKNGLTGTKGKGEDGWVGRDKGGVRRMGVLKLACMEGWEKGEGCTTQRRQVVILQHFAMLMDSDCNAVFRGTWYRGGHSKHSILHVSVD